MKRLRKSLASFKHVYRIYKHKRKKLASSEKSEIISLLNHLQEDLISRDRAGAHDSSEAAEAWAHVHMKKSFFERVCHFIFSLGFALIVAILVRSIWFEFYEIPTGSMRPTFKEQDRLVVSKTAFGINIPLSRGHFYFDPDLIKRSGTLIFTGKGMDIPDLDTLYFYLFPGTKQFVKRLIGKPGDTLYFYGGLIYGIDKEGNDISAELQPKELSLIDHVPYISFNGRVNLPSDQKGNIYSPVILHQMNEKVARLSISGLNKVKGELLSPYKERMSDYFDLWGIKNYGMARLLTKKEVAALTDTLASNLEDAPLYMQIFHHPSVLHPIIQRDGYGRLYPGAGISQAILPLQKNHLQTLFKNLYTARFVVKDGIGKRYGSKAKSGIELPGVPNGTYEFYHGKAYQILWQGIPKQLPKSHPLYAFSPEKIQTLYNLGIEWSSYFKPQKNLMLLPSRYVYYRNGGFYALGAPLMEQNDKTLVNFIQHEYLKQAGAPSYSPYHPFDDEPPLLNAEGKIDFNFIKQYGVNIPKDHYLVLGDNYAMSADSRDFGFVPEMNIRGAPSFIFWPFGSRFGTPLQVPYPFFNAVRLIIWPLAAFIFFIWWLWHRKQSKLPIKIE